MKRNRAPEDYDITPTKNLKVESIDHPIRYSPPRTAPGAPSKINEFKVNEFNIKDEKPVETDKIPVPLVKRAKIELSEAQKLVVILASKGHNIFLTGNAGVGKSLVLEAIIEDLIDNKYGNSISVAITAPTGIAAFNIGGRTIHSWSGIGIDREMSIEKEAKIIMSKPAVMFGWKNTKTLIIDEVSMLSAEMLDKLDVLARILLNSDKPFGGIQVILCGDFLQLPPVPEKNSTARFAFTSTTWEALELKTVELKEQFRQKNDNTFTTILNELRVGKLSDKSTLLLQGCINKELKVTDIEPTKLYAKNIDVDAENEGRLKMLTTEVHTYYARDTGSSYAVVTLNKVCMAPVVLNLKVGAQVVLLRNLSVADGLVNGSRGVVVGFVDGYPQVRFHSCETTIIISPVTWEIIEKGTVIASRSQHPLKLAWAITTHKSQGMTLDLVETKLEGMFENGQAYVAFSRCKSLDGLRITGKWEHWKIKAHPLALKFYNNL